MRVFVLMHTDRYAAPHTPCFPCGVFSTKEKAVDCAKTHYHADPYDIHIVEYELNQVDDDKMCDNEISFSFIKRNGSWEAEYQ